MRHGLAVWLTLSALLTPSASCGSEEEEAPVAAAPTINRRGPRATLLASAPSEEAQPRAPSTPFVLLRPPTQPPPAQAAKAADEAKPEEKEKPRDYSNELVQAVSGTEGCVKQRPATETLPEKTSVSLEAYVLESGAVSRGYARSSHLTTEELECVKQRIEHARFAPAVEGAPRRVDATVQLTFKRPEPSGAATTTGTKGAPTAAPAVVPAAAPASGTNAATNGPQTPPAPGY